MALELSTCRIPGIEPLQLAIKDNAVSATAFKDIKSAAKPGERPENETEKGLRVLDKGFLNTAVMQSQITYIDGEAGGELFNHPNTI